MKRVDELTHEIQASDDVDEVMAKYETAAELLRGCASVIERARGQMHAPLLAATEGVGSDGVASHEKK